MIGAVLGGGWSRGFAGVIARRWWVPDQAVRVDMEILWIFWMFL